MNDSKTKFHIIADAAFPLEPWLMKPFEIKNNMPILEKNFNYRLSSARMTVENSFGRLKARWRILLKKPDVHIDTMRKIIHTCILLHNFCEVSKEGVDEEWIQEANQEEESLQQTDSQNEENFQDTDGNPQFGNAKQKRIDVALKR